MNRQISDEFTAQIDAEILRQLQGGEPPKTYEECVKIEREYIKTEIHKVLTQIKEMYGDAIIICRYEDGTRDNPPNWGIKIYNAGDQINNISLIIDDLADRIDIFTKYVFLFTTINGKKPNTDKYFIL